MAQLDKSTWVVAWPGKTRPQGDGAVLQALKDYKNAKAGQSILVLRSALELLIGLLEGTEKEAAITFKSHPLDKKRAEKALAEMKEQATNELKAAKVSTNDVVVYKRPFGTALAEKLSDDFFKAAPRPVELSILGVFADEIRARNGEAMLNIACNKAFDGAVKECARAVEAFIAEQGGLLGSRHIRSIDTLVDSACRGLSDELRVIPGQVLRKIGMNEKIAKEYKLDKAISIGIAAGSVIVSGAGIAVPGTTPLAIAMTVRAAIALFKEIAIVAASIEKKIAAFNAYLVVLEMMFTKAASAHGKLSPGEKFGEVTIDAVNKIVGIDVFPTIKKAKDDFKEIEQSVAVMYAKSQKLQAEVIDAIAKCSKCTKELLTNHDSKAFRSGKLMKSLEKAEAALTKLLDSTHEVVKRTLAADEEVPVLRRNLKALGEPGTTVETAQKVIGVLVHVAAAAGGLTDAAVAGGAAVESLLLAAEGALLEAESTVKELV